MTSSTTTRLHEYLTEVRDEMTGDLESVVSLESPSDDAPSLTVAATALVDLARRRLACDATLVMADVGPHVLIEVGGRGPLVLLIGHYDTVWPLGTLARVGFSSDGLVARGPGVFDMKAGLVQGVWALEALQRLGMTSPRVAFLVTSDEELGSPTSREIVEDLGRQADFALVLEPSGPGGAAKTSRKGLGFYRIDITGRASHAGLDPTAGVSAIAEIADFVQAVLDASDPSAGTTINVGRIGGGTRPNVVAAHAWCEIDVRVGIPDEARRIEELMLGLVAHREGATLTVSGGMNRDPLVRTAAVGELFDCARTIALDLGLDLAEVSVGGGSDGNLIAAVGTPVLDGLGPPGGNAHAEGEWVSVAELPRRAALVASLLTSLVEAPAKTEARRH